MGVDGIELPEASLAAMARRTTVFFLVLMSVFVPSERKLVGVRL